MALDRALQKIVLEDAAVKYPEALFPITVAECFWKLYPRAPEDLEDELDIMELHLRQQRLQPLMTTLSYLEERGLIITEVTSCAATPYVTITADGLDFLEDDGGLSAILNTVTVKFDTNNLRSIIEAGILKSSLPDEQKSSLKSKVKELPGTALEKLTSKMLDEFLSDPTKAIKLIASAVGVTL